MSKVGENRKFNRKIRKEKAITLIALVITIIVLLILAGVTIAALSGDNGILTQSAKSKIENAKGELKDKITLKQLEDLENTEPETEVYDSILNKIDGDDEAIEMKGNEVKYNAEKFTDIEQRILRNEIELGSMQDETKPYGTIEKEIVDGKVKLKIYTADDETDVRKIILPDGTEKKIEYDTEKILYRYNVGLGEELKNFSNENVNKLKEYFKNIEIDCENSDVLNVKGKYNILLDLNMFWGIDESKASFIKSCFDKGLNIITSGNDTKAYLYIIDKVLDRQTINGTVKVRQDNEVMKYYIKDFLTDTRDFIDYIDGVDVWASEEVNGKEYDLIGLLKGNKENYWLDIHDGLLEGLKDNRNDAIFIRNSIYRLLGTRSAEYEVTQNGTYVFKIEDLSRNIEEISVEVTEI